MSVEAKILYNLSQAGQRDSLQRGGDGKKSQSQVGQVQPGDIGLFEIDQDGHLTFDATQAPEECRTAEYHSFVGPKGRTWNGWVSIEWDVLPDWDGLMKFARWVDEVSAELGRQAEAAREAFEEKRQQTGLAFLAHQNARASHVEEDSVTIDGYEFWMNDPVAVEAKRRWAHDLDERRKANKATVSSWIIHHGSANQRERLAAGLLPWQEGAAALEQYLFAPLESFPLYERWQIDEICVCSLSGETPCGVKFQSVDATELTAKEWEQYSAIRAAVSDAKFQLREHRASCKSRAETEMRRGVIVKRTLGSLTFKREYALGGTHDLAGV